MPKDSLGYVGRCPDRSAFGRQDPLAASRPRGVVQVDRAQSLLRADLTIMMVRRPLLSSTEGTLRGLAGAGAFGDG